MASHGRTVLIGFFLLFISTAKTHEIQVHEFPDVQGVQGAWKETLQLGCPGHYGLHIVDSSFGNPLLVGATIYKNDRDAPHAKLVVKQHCEKRKSCELFVDPTTFGILRSVGLSEPKLAITYACLEDAQEGSPDKTEFQALQDPQGGWNVMIPSDEVQADVRELRSSYVHLRDIDAECGKPLGALRDIQTIEEAENRCADEEQCTFIIARPHKVIMCAADTYEKPRRESGSMVYVKASKAFGRATKKFTLHPNVQSVCERHDLLGESADVRNAEDAAEQCELAGCDFFVMSTVNQLRGATSDYTNHVWLCKGRPTYIPFDGFVLGERRGGANMAGDVCFEPLAAFAKAIIKPSNTRDEVVQSGWRNVTSTAAQMNRGKISDQKAQVAARDLHSAHVMLYQGGEVAKWREYL